MCVAYLKDLWKPFHHRPCPKATWQTKKQNSQECYRMMQQKLWCGCCGSADWVDLIFPSLFADWHLMSLDGANGMILNFIESFHIWKALYHTVVVAVFRSGIRQYFMHIVMQILHPALGQQNQPVGSRLELWRGNRSSLFSGRAVSKAASPGPLQKLKLSHFRNCVRWNATHPRNLGIPFWAGHSCNAWTGQRSCD